MAASGPGREEPRPEHETYFAHSENPTGQMDPLPEHLRRVAELAAEYAASFGAAGEARLAGLLHDLGKYGAKFQARLEGREHGIDHWSMGAWAALMRYKQAGLGVAMAAQGHHVGLQHLDKDSLRELEPHKLEAQHPQQRKLSDADFERLLARLASNGIELPRLASSECSIARTDHAANMLDVRMLFSALVDADFVDTEGHFDAIPGQTRTYREPGPELCVDKAIAALDEHIAKVGKDAGAAPAVITLRRDLRAACRDKSPLPTGLFTLSAPTGSGKTLAMLAFALAHAQAHGLRRIVVVIPYLSIIEQTARIYRDIFEPHFGPHYVLEHHSLAGMGENEAGDATDDQSAAERARRLLAENWDAPIVVTTSVQFFDSLLSNRPSACRKLHRLAQSVVLFDEAQTLPQHLAVPTLATLSHLAARYGTTVVFATATQPAFDHLHEYVKLWATQGWQPTEIASPELKLFARAKRTEVLWPDPGHTTPWPSLADELAQPGNERSLCVVNLKRHALELLSALEERQAPGLCHLSTNMCPAHRLQVLANVRERLADGRPCRLISTQCVEAGVDVDFPVAYRAFGPLEAIAQAAGRCNREGKNSSHGQVRVFMPEDKRYPASDYEQAAQTTSLLLTQLCGREHG